MRKAATPAPAQLILASGSRYRAELLSRLGLPFRSQASQADETPRPGEAAEALVTRLATTKAQVLQQQHPDAWILGSDQLAVCDGRLLGKPGDRAATIAQLRAASGRSVEFLTAVTLLTPQGRSAALDRTIVQFRAVTGAEIEAYVDREPAYDCAGGFKCEGLGIALFERLDTQDPTALVGLPLIAVCRLLREAGYPAL